MRIEADQRCRLPAVHGSGRKLKAGFDAPLFFVELPVHPGLLNESKGMPCKKGQRLIVAVGQRSDTQKATTF